MDNEWKEFTEPPIGAVWDIAIRCDEKIVIISKVYFVDGKVISWFDSKRDYYKKYPNFTITNIRPYKGK